MRRSLGSVAAALLVACTTLKAAEETDAGEPRQELPPAPAVSDGSRTDPPSVPPDAVVPVPSCSGRTCGRDPTTDASCGTCTAAETCEESSTGAGCRAPTIEWLVDGTRVAAKASADAWYFSSSGTYAVMFPTDGRNVQINLGPEATVGTTVSCPNNAVVSLSTGDNTYSGLDALPSVLRNLIFITCGPNSSGDVVVGRTVTLTQLGPARIAGNYEWVVVGKGPREGSTLRVRGAFDVAPKNM